MRNAIVALIGALLVGAVVYSSLGGSQREAALREVGRLSPSSRLAPCASAGEEAQPFAAALKLDPPCSWVHSRPGPTLRKLAAAAGPEGVPFFEKALAGCGLDEPTRAACGALDALALRAEAGDAAALNALRKQGASTRSPREKWLGALLRAWAAQAPTTGEVIAVLEADPDPRARADLLMVVRSKKDPSSRQRLQRLYDGKRDPLFRAGVRAALLELDHPGDCISEDDGHGSGAVCAYSCPGEAARRAVQKQPDMGCPLTFTP